MGSDEFKEWGNLGNLFHGERAFAISQLICNNFLMDLLHYVIRLFGPNSKFMKKVLMTIYLTPSIAVVAGCRK